MENYIENKSKTIEEDNVERIIKKVLELENRYIYQPKRPQSVNDVLAIIKEVVKN